MTMSGFSEHHRSLIETNDYPLTIPFHAFQNKNHFATRKITLALMDKNHLFRGTYSLIESQTPITDETRNPGDRTGESIKKKGEGAIHNTTTSYYKAYSWGDPISRVPRP